MTNPKCPYCNVPQEINHDDGYGLDVTGEFKYKQECDHCGQTFEFDTDVVMAYKVRKVEGESTSDTDDDYYKPDASGYSRADEEWFFGHDGKP